MKPLIIRKLWDKISEIFPVFSLEVAYFRRDHNFEPDIWLASKYCDPKKIALDIGANMGIYSRFMSKYSGHVHSFECNPNLHDHLRTVISKNCTLHELALSDHNGRVELRFDPHNTGIGTIELNNRLDQNDGIKEIISTEVDITRLDDLNFKDVSFVKIDVEGHELSVLLGGIATLRSSMPTLLIEIEERHCAGNLVAVPSLLRPLGYEAFFLGDKGKLIVIDDLEVAASGGINNFWFLRSSMLSSMLDS